MVRTIIILIFTLIVLPLAAIKFFPIQLLSQQIQMIKGSAIIMLVTAMLCFTLAEATHNCSQVDKIWSIMPVIYAWYFAAVSGWNHRLILMALCVSVWGIRLTYNFSRRGAYRLKFWEGEEDYRWEVLRQNNLFKGKPLRWTLFNFFFISFYQNVLIWLFTLPAMMADYGQDKPLSLFDFIIAVLIIVFVVIETIADQQQWNFQNEKQRKKKAGAMTGDFVQTGLWGTVRHPNYAAEQAIWLCFYLFSVVATAKAINWSMAGCLLLLILFQGSSDFSEGISLSKYPAYKDYQQRVGRFLPKIF